MPVPTSQPSHRHLHRCILAVVALVMLVVGHAATTAQAATPGLHVQGVTLVNTDGSRFIVAGINMEMYRDYDNGCGWVTDGTYAIRGVMADKVKTLGVNAVRLNYAYRFLAQSGNLTKFLDMAQELANRGMYVMPSDHTYTGGVLTGAAASYPMMKQIIDGMRARGLENYLIMNPYNEPGPDISVAQWVQAQKDVLTYLRNTAGFNGVVVMDGTGWATLLDVTAFKSVMTFDAGLRGGTANVAFSMHLYPNIAGLPSQLWSAASQVPLVVGELGQENPGASPLDPQYVKNVISGALNTGIPNGHNGLFAWIFAWCDTNKMIEDWSDPAAPYTATSPLTSHGTLWRDSYYNKLPTSAPVPTIIAQQPTTTGVPATKTATPRPATITLQPPPGSTLLPPATNTFVPPPSTATGDRTFYRAINFGGAAVTIGGKAWEASASAPNLTVKAGTYQDCNSYAPVAPAVDASTEQMLECYVEHWNHSLTLSAVPSASYDVYVYTWQDWNQPDPGTVNFSVNGAVTQANYALSSTAGQWTRLGPWRVNVTTGSLALTTSGADIKLSGMEVWRVTSGAPSTAVPTIIAQQPTATKTNTAVPPTATKTNTPRPATIMPTRTSIPPTATRTSPPATATKTNTPRPATVTPTRTALPPTVPPPTTDGTFYRAINFAGPAVNINGKAWEASTGAPNFTIRAGTHQECNTYIPMIPAVDTATDQMLECFAEHWSHIITVSAVPNATYDVYLYTWQDWNEPKPGTATFKLNDVVVQSDYAISSQQGRWERLGPWRVKVTAGSLKLTSNGSNIKLSGMEVWRVGAAPSDGVVMAPTSTPVTRLNAPSMTATPGSTTAIPTGFYRAVNLNGSALVLDGQQWDGDTAANLTVTGDTACQPATALTPAVDVAHTEMLRCYVTGNNVAVVLTNVPAGYYQVVAYLWQADATAQSSLTLQGGQAIWMSQPSSTPSTWQQTAPLTVTVDETGTLSLDSAGKVVNLAGLALYRIANPETSTEGSQAPIAPTFVPDQAGQPAAATAIPSQPLTQVVESDDARLTRTGDWKAQATGKASGGSYLFSSAAQLSFTFTGTQLDVLYVQHPALGSFAISIDGVVVQTVDSRSEQTHFQAVASVRDLAAGQHTVLIYATDGAIAIDAVVLPQSATLQ